MDMSRRRFLKKASQAAVLAGSVLSLRSVSTGGTAGHPDCRHTSAPVGPEPDQTDMAEPAPGPELHPEGLRRGEPGSPYCPGGLHGGGGPPGAAAPGGTVRPRTVRGPEQHHACGGARGLAHGRRFRALRHAIQGQPLCQRLPRRSCRREDERRADDQEPEAAGLAGHAVRCERAAAVPGGGGETGRAVSRYPIRPRPLRKCRSRCVLSRGTHCAQGGPAFARIVEAGYGCPGREGQRRLQDLGRSWPMSRNIR